MTGHHSRQPKAALGPGKAGKFRTLACAALAGGMFLFAASPAEAQVWSATLTVDFRGSDGERGCSNAPGHTSCSTALTDNDFDYKGTTYTVADLYWRPAGQNQIGLGLEGLSTAQVKTALGSLRLNVGGLQLAISDGVRGALGNVLWQNISNPGWTDGQTISVSLTAPAARPNRPPKVSASCDPCDVPPGGEVRLTATASDPDGDQLSYRWSATEGSFLLRHIDNSGTRVELRTDNTMASASCGRTVSSDGRGSPTGPPGAGPRVPPPSRST